LPLAGFQKWWALCCPLLKENCSSATYLPDFKTGAIAPCWFSKAIGATLRHRKSNRSKGFELADFKMLLANSKLLVLNG
jgi:hypothetical protein